MAEPTTESLLAELRALIQGNVQENLATTTSVTAYLLERFNDQLDEIVSVTIRSTAIDTTILSTDQVLLVDAGSGDIELTLPVLTEPQSFVVKKTDTGTNKITLVRSGSETVEGAAANLDLPSSTNDDRPSWTLLFVGSSVWWVL